MSNENNIKTLITAFVSDLQAAIRASALEAATAALSGPIPVSTTPDATPAAAPADSAKAASKKAPKAAKKAPGAKRDPAELEKLVESLHAQIKKDPARHRGLSQRPWVFLPRNCLSRSRSFWLRNALLLRV